MNQPKALTSRDLLQLFKDRGMAISEQDLDKINHINYYKLKEFAHPLSKIKKTDNQVNISYEGVSFQEVLARYYQDKNLRIHMMHAIEKIEVSIKTNISHIMGLKYGAFGYLNFGLWTHRNKFTKFTIEERQYKLKKSLLYYMDRTHSSDYNRRENKDSDGFPTIWLAIDLLTFGDVVNMLEMMSSSLLSKLAKVYECTPEEFLSWIKCLHFVRNVCAHNSNLIDIKLKTKPKYRKEWTPLLYFMHTKDGKIKSPSNRLAVVIFIVVSLISIINPKYKWKGISSSLHSICGKSDARANLLGFSSASYGRSACEEIKKCTIKKLVPTQK